jgi:hypothetical protein
METNLIILLYIHGVVKFIQLCPLFGYGLLNVTNVLNGVTLSIDSISPLDDIKKKTNLISRIF